MLPTLAGRHLLRPSPDRPADRWIAENRRSLGQAIQRSRGVQRGTKTTGCDALPRINLLDGGDCNGEPNGALVLANNSDGVVTLLTENVAPQYAGTAVANVVTVPTGGPTRGPALSRRFVDSFGNKYDEAGVCIGSGFDSQIPVFPHGGQNPASGSFQYGKVIQANPLAYDYHRFFITEENPRQTWLIPGRWDFLDTAYAYLPVSGNAGGTLAAIRGICEQTGGGKLRTKDVIYCAEWHAVGPAPTTTYGVYPAHGGIGMTVRDGRVPGRIGSGPVTPDLPLIARDPAPDESPVVSLAYNDYPRGPNGDVLSGGDFFPISSIGPFFPQATISTDEFGWAWMVLIPRAVTADPLQPLVTTADFPLTVRGCRFSFDNGIFELATPVTLTDPDGLSTGFPAVASGFNSFIDLVVAAIYEAPE